MLNARWMTLVTAGLLISSAVRADDATPSSADSETRPAVTPTKVMIDSGSEYANRWQLSQPVGATDYTNDWTRPIASFEFQDPSALGRVSKLRGLSIFTLAERGQTRLFLGVNEKGLFGLHFRALPSHGDDRYLEFLRMPYLKQTQPDGDAE